MNQEELISFLDLLDLDEEVIDNRLKSFMTKSNFTNEHLASIIHLLQYKTLLNTQENTECDNTKEFDFIVTLLQDLSYDNVDKVCKIVYIVLCLNPSTLASKGEHLLQQILVNIELQTETTNKTENSTDVLRNLKICDSILDAVIKFNGKLSLYFTKIPLENILEYPDETLKKYFLNSTVPKLFNGIIGYNILDRIWDYVIKLSGDKKSDALKIMSCLADFYLPSQEKGKAEIISDVITLYDFWSLLLYGMSSENAPVRKISVYLAKRAIDCVLASEKNIQINSMNVVVFSWRSSQSNVLKSMWDNFFILIESLEEKQGNIVLPSLKLFETIDIGELWMHCAFKIGLKHDNFQVRMKCIEFRLNYRIKNQSEACMVLEALNDINIYDQNTSYDVIKIKLSELVNDEQSLMEIFKTIPLIKWSPVPFHHVIAILCNFNKEVHTGFIVAAVDVLKTPCNNILLRKEIHTNVGNILIKCSKLIKWQEMVRIYTSIGFENPSQLEPNHPLVILIKKVTLEPEEKLVFLEEILKSSKNVDILILYLCHHKDDENIFIDLINKKFNILDQLEETQMSNIKEDLHFVINMLLLHNETKLSRNLENIRTLIAKRNCTLFGYIYKLFKEGVNINLEDIIALLKVKNAVYEDSESVLRMSLYRKCLVAHFMDADVKHTPNPNSFCIVHPAGNAEFTLTRKVLYMFLLRIILNNPQNPLSEQSGALKLLDDTLTLFYEYRSNEKSFDCVGRLKNVDQEIFCEVIYLLAKKANVEELQICLVVLIDYTENALECGGYGCLEWVLKISNIIMKYLVNRDEDFNLPQFLNKLWREIEELKSNNQYNVCIKLFIELLTNNSLLENENYNNIVTSYISKIMELSSVKIYPLYYLLKQLKTKEINKYGHLVYGFCDMLLFNPVKRKDERITDNICIQLLEDRNASIKKNGSDIIFTFKLQYLSLYILCNIKDAQTIKIIRKLITNKIDELFKNKQRYHGNSQLHKTLQIAVQHLITLVLLDRSDLEDVFNWSLDMFVKLPHQNSVRICFEWFIALYFYINKITINEEMLQALKVKNVPLISQFFVVYWLLKHKIKNNSFLKAEFDFAMDFLLSHTMGQLFNVRLNAQYLSTILYKLSQKSTKFEYIIKMIEKTFAESSTDKTYIKLQSDYFVHDFDIVANLTPYFLYHILPNHCGVTINEKVMVDFVKNITDSVVKNVRDVNGDEIISEWMNCQKSNKDFVDLEENKNVDNDAIVEDINLTGIIQKKYIPWRNMCDVNVYDVLKKQQSSSELIVVASLIDKLPNLGGMARTSEVFGVKTYVVDSLRHLQDKQFQNLSVSAERWIDVEEVRPGKPLRNYLMKMKSEGYSIVAAEQTSSSHQLQTFKFPKKTLILLGHEKEGVPCDLLPIMDYCVEIPQQGYVRSLNVHVTAAIFVWEYARQHVL